MQKRLFNEDTAECNGLENHGFYRTMRMHAFVSNPSVFVRDFEK